MVFCVSAMICMFLAESKFLAQYTTARRSDLTAKQKMHARPTSRLGGVGILISFIAAVVFLPQLQGSFFSFLLLSLIPVTFAGLAEDIGFRVSARGRLIAAAISAICAIYLLDVWIPPIDVQYLDLVFKNLAIVLIITVIWSTGVCHALNLIDGVNGLAAGVSAMIAIGLTFVAVHEGAFDFALGIALLIPALLGFLFLNWPSGRIFLGDAGAYSIGHVLVWSAIGLSWYHSDISPIALSLMFFWPVADTFLAIGRRMSRGSPVSAPDKLHFHQLVARSIIVMSNGSLSLSRANSLTVPILFPFVAAPMITSVCFSDSNYIALLAWCIFGVLFFLSYVIGIKLFQSMRFRAYLKLKRNQAKGFVKVKA